MPITIDTTRSGAGFRHAIAFQLDADGTITAVGSTPTKPYEGIIISGVKQLTITAPAPRQIVHTGDDIVIATMALPPNTATTGQLTTAKIDDELEAVLSDINRIEGPGAGAMFGLTTSQQGNEPYLCMVAFRQAVDTLNSSDLFGQVTWEGKIFPRIKIIPMDVGFTDTAETKTYQLFPQFCTRYPWGIKFSAAVEKFKRAYALRSVTLGKPHFATFLAEGSTPAYVFNTDFPAIDATTIEVWVVDASTFVTAKKALTTDYTATTTGISFTMAGQPGTGDKVIVWYETDYEG